MVDFNKLLSPESRARLAREASEIDRLYRLPSRFLAEALLKLSRLTIAASCHLKPYGVSYDDTYFWHIVPEVARRLGATQFKADELGQVIITRLSNSDLRIYAGNCMHNISQFDHRSPLLREPIHGNPLCFALDRISPPTDLALDPIAKMIAGPANSRGIAFDGVWTPALVAADLRLSKDFGFDEVDDKVAYGKCDLAGVGGVNIDGAVSMGESRSNVIPLRPK